MNVATCVKERGWCAINNFQCEKEAASSWGESEKISQGTSALYKALTGLTHGPRSPVLPPPLSTHPGDNSWIYHHPSST